MNKDDIKIVLVSDNHMTRHGLDYVRSAHSDADYFIHCGDSEMPKYEMGGFACVQGNNDWFGEYPPRLTLEIGMHRILVTHGHRDFFYGRFDMLADRARAFDCDIVCFGHTHIYFDETVNGIRLLNPGSIWRNRDGSKPSYMLINLQGKKIITKRMTYEINSLKNGK